MWTTQKRTKRSQLFQARGYTFVLPLYGTCFEAFLETVYCTTT